MNVPSHGLYPNRGTSLITTRSLNDNAGSKQMQRKLSRLLILFVVYQIRIRYCKYNEKEDPWNVIYRQILRLYSIIQCALFKSPTMENKHIRGIIFVVRCPLNAFTRSIGFLFFRRTIVCFVFVKVWMRMFTVSIRSARNVWNKGFCIIFEVWICT